MWEILLGPLMKEALQFETAVIDRRYSVSLQAARKLRALPKNRHLGFRPQVRRQSETAVPWVVGKKSAQICAICG